MAEHDQPDYKTSTPVSDTPQSVSSSYTSADLSSWGDDQTAVTSMVGNQAMQSSLTSPGSVNYSYSPMVSQYTPPSTSEPTQNYSEPVSPAAPAADDLAYGYSSLDPAQNYSEMPPDASQGSYPVSSYDTVTADDVSSSPQASTSSAAPAKQDNGSGPTGPARQSQPDKKQNGTGVKQEGDGAAKGGGGKAGQGQTAVQVSQVTDAVGKQSSGKGQRARKRANAVREEDSSETMEILPLLPLDLPLIIPLDMPAVPRIFAGPDLQLKELENQDKGKSSDADIEAQRRILVQVLTIFEDTKDTAEDLQISVYDRGQTTMRSLDEMYRGIANQIPVMLQQANSQVTSIYQTAESTVSNSAEESDRTIVQSFWRTHAALKKAKKSGLGMVEDNAKTADSQVSTILTNLGKKYVDALAAAQKKSEEKSIKAYDNIEAWKKNFSRDNPFTGKFDYESAENEAKGKRAPKLADNALGILAQRSTEISGQFAENTKKVQGDIHKNVHPPLSAYAKRIGTEGKESVINAHKTALNAVRQQKNAARKAVRKMRDETLQQLRTSQTAVQAQLESEAKQTMASVRQESSRAVESVSSALAQSLPHYGQAARSFKETLTNGAKGAPENTLQVAKEASPKIEESLEGAARMQGDQMDNVASRVSGSLEQRRQESNDRLNGLVADSTVQTQNTTTQTAATMMTSAERMTSGFSSAADGVNSASTNWSRSIETVFKDFIEAHQKELDKNFDQKEPSFKSRLDDQVEKFIKWVKPQMTPKTFPYFVSELKSVRDAVHKDFNGRTERLAHALDHSEWFGNDVDEKGVSDQLRAITRAMGIAIEARWEGAGEGYDAFSQKSLRQTLADKLEDDEDDYNSAINYLNGNAAEGARYELKASKHWYNDEEARIEAVMRSLSKEQMAELHRLDAHEVEDTRDALGGTDLKVFDALVEGNHAKADALRALDRLRSAKRSNDADEVNSTLTAYSGEPNPADYGGKEGITADERRQAFNQELAILLQGDKAIKDKPLSNEQAAQKVFDYVKEPVIIHRSTGDGGSYTQELKIEGAQLDLAHDLIFKGDKSAEARASRAKVEIDRGGGPKMLNLDTALVDPRLNPNTYPDGVVPEKIKEEALKERGEMMKIFAQRYGKPGEADTVAKAQQAMIGQLEGAFDDDRTGRKLATNLVKETNPSPATAALAMEYGQAGLGTKEALLDRFTQRMNRVELQDMRKIYDATGRNLYADLGIFGQGSWGELSGDDRQRMERNFFGKPRNDQERAEAAAYAVYQQRKETGALGEDLASGSLQDKVLASNEKSLNRMLGGGIEFGGLDPETGLPNMSETHKKKFGKEGEYLGDSAEFAGVTTGATLAAELYSAKIDQYANMASIAIAVAGAVAAAVATVLTGGAASPLLMAAIAGVSGLAAAGTQAAIKGGRYGWEQAATDLGMTAVQALTAGVGQSLALASRGGVAGLQAGMKTGLSMSAARELAKGGTLASVGTRLTGSAFGDKVLIGAIGGGLNSLGTTALSEQTYAKGGDHAFNELIFGTLKGIASGGATATASNVIDDLPLNRLGKMGQAASKYLGDDTLGGAVGKSTSFVGRGLGKSASSFAGGFAGKMAETGVEYVKDPSKVDAGEALMASGGAGLQNVVQSFGEGAAEAGAQRYMNRQASQSGTVSKPSRPVGEGEPEQPAVRPTSAPDDGPAGPPSKRPSETEPAEGQPAAKRPSETEPAEGPAAIKRPTVPEVETPSVKPAPSAAEEGGQPARKPAAIEEPEGAKAVRPPAEKESRVQTRSEVVEDAEILRTMLEEIAQKRSMAPGDALTETNLADLPDAVQPARRAGEREPGRSQIPSNVAASLRARARRAFGRDLQAALLDPSEHTPLTLKTLEYLTPAQIAFVQRTGRLPRGFEFDHFLAVADFPEFAHRSDVGTALPKDVHREAAHAGDTTRPREAGAMLDPAAETRPAMHLDPESVEGPLPGHKTQAEQVAEGLRRTDNMDNDILLGQQAELSRMRGEATKARRRGKPDLELEGRIAATEKGLAEFEQRLKTAASEPQEPEQPANRKPAEEPTPAESASKKPPASEEGSVQKKGTGETDRTAEGRETAVQETAGKGTAGKSGAAAGVELSTFEGRSKQRRSTDVLDEAADATRSLAEHGSTAKFSKQVGEDPLHIKLTLPEDGGEVPVRIKEAHDILSIDPALPRNTDPVPVARYVFDEATGEYHVYISKRATQGVVERALAHELTEIRATHGPQTDLPDALTPRGFGSEHADKKAAPALSAHDKGRLAELEVLQRQIKAAAGDEQKVAHLRDETERLLAHLGLVEDTPGAKARRQLLDSELSGNDEHQRFVQDHIESAKKNPFLTRPPTDPAEFFDFILKRLAHAKQMGDEARVEQVYQQATESLNVGKGRYLKTADGRFIDLGSERDLLSYIETSPTRAKGGREVNRQFKQIVVDYNDDEVARSVMAEIKQRQSKRKTGEDLRPTEIDPDTTAASRREFADLKHFQDWDEFRGYFFNTSATPNADQIRFAFRLWSAGHYIDPVSGQVNKLMSGSRKPDIMAHTPIQKPFSRELPAGHKAATVLEKVISLMAELETTTSGKRRAEINKELESLPKLKRASEDVGEAAAKLYAETQYGIGEGDLTTSRGSGVPDLIFKKPGESDRFVIIEAKGGGSELGTRLNIEKTKLVEQGTKEYVESLAQAMQHSSNEKIRQLGRDLEAAIRAGKVDYIVVRQPYDRRNGSLVLPEAHEYDVSRPGKL